MVHVSPDKEKSTLDYRFTVTTKDDIQVLAIINANTGNITYLEEFVTAYTVSKLGGFREHGKRKKAERKKWYYDYKNWKRRNDTTKFLNEFLKKNRGSENCTYKHVIDNKKIIIMDGNCTKPISPLCSDLINSSAHLNNDTKSKEMIQVKFMNLLKYLQNTIS